MFIARVLPWLVMVALIFVAVLIVRRMLLSSRRRRLLGEISEVREEERVVDLEDVLRGEKARVDAKRHKEEPSTRDDVSPEGFVHKVKEERKS